ncbi:MAG: polysaccharide biosynthesis C-terminal domain-containing protein [Lachnospiraceae bacterium]
MPIVLSTVIYNIGTVLDQGVFNAILAGQGYTEKQYVTIWGVYSGEFRVLMNVPLSIASCLAPSVVPSLAAVMSDNDTKEASIKVRDTIRYTMILTIPCAVGFLALSSPIMQLIFSDSTELASGIMQTGSLLIVLLGLSTLTTGILQGLGRMKEPMIHSAIALVLHLILLAILMTVFKLNIYGVLYSNIFFGLIMCILNAISIKKYLRYRQELVRTFIIPLVSSGIMGLAAYGVYNLCHLAVGNAISCLAAILVAIVVYGVVLIKLRGITERTLRHSQGRNSCRSAEKMQTAVKRNRSRELPSFTISAPWEGSHDKYPSGAVRSRRGSLPGSDHGAFHPHGRLRKTCHLSAVRLCRGLRKASEKSGFFL